MSSERLWAPWRLAYITGQSAAQTDPAVDRPLLPGGEQACFLCRNAVDDRDRQNHVVYRGQGVMAALNRYPYNNGHVLVAPLRHLARLDELDRQLQAGCLDLISRLVGLLEKLLHAEGINIGLNLGRVAGAGVPGHLHWHIVPRWTGDNNFMPVVADTRVISQSLDAVWELLAPALAEQPSGGTAGSDPA
ncbi:MAG TPA: HIT domain-containing protein [Pirellulales bacterium]